MLVTPAIFKGADRQVAPSGHGAWCVADSQLGGVLGKRRVADRCAAAVPGSVDPAAEGLSRL